MSALSTIWSQIQRVLLPVVEEEIGPLTLKQRELTVLLDVIRIEEFVAAPPRGWRGRPDEDRRPLARAFVAKAVLNLPTTRALLDQLHGAATCRAKPRSRAPSPISPRASCRNACTPR